MANYYDSLGVPRAASQKDIRQAYRKLAREFHPDVNQGNKASEEEFKTINEAYSVLSDPEKRRKYDRYGNDWMHSDRIEEAQAQARRGGSYRWSTHGGDDPFGAFGEEQSSVFDRLFSNIGRERRRPAPAEYPTTVTLNEAFEGTTRVLQQPGGRRLEVKIPPGVDNGSKVRVSAGSGQRDDIFLVISVHPQPRFQRQGRDLYTEVEVPVEDAILGGETTVETLRGKVALTIPPETQNGQRFRLAGQGMPALNDPKLRGDLYATTNVRLPTGLTPEQLELFRRLRESRSGDVRDGG
ncbi:MAG: J domain-containing protein [Dehalococcoidia bacterium]|jgi:DnaJ-class molecular chaperone|nr:J domain-containing protein [Dehalococcoidia bacterium]MDP6226444.1 J domain-containing protein [Dehalococcoidia bacterium]MDP7084553.1 J domain-containing protein [Dehalococcoidia bacterium]MDP7201523.1 J domain-containing protein [Dehalococcoidia bacterium]MDP7511960.1 J domain-containing protein [Dehalococcoidia bacterium]